MLTIFRYFLNKENNKILPSKINNKREENIKNKLIENKLQNNNYFAKLPISSNKRDFCSINNTKPLNKLSKNNIRTKKRNCNFLKTNNTAILSINENLFADDIKVLSTARESASGSVVLYNNHNGYGYVYKISRAHSENVKKEADIYKRLNQLIFHKVCPHLFLTFGSGIIEFKGDTSSSRIEALLNGVNWNGERTYFCQINETGPDTKLVMPFYMLYATKHEGVIEDCKCLKGKKETNFIRVFYNLLFQVYWVQYIFGLIGFSQDDLHHGNIMLIFNKINIFDTPDDDSFKPDNIKYRSYTFKKDHTNPDSETKTYYLEDLGIDLYVYDFDHSSFNNQSIGTVPELKFMDTVLQRLSKQNETINNINLDNVKILDIEYLNNLTMESGMSDTGNINSFMYYYISVVMSFVPHLNMYKDLYMLVSDKPETDITNKSTVTQYTIINDKNNKSNKSNIIKAHHPNESIMDSIKKRVHGSYSTEPLFKKLSGNTTNTSKKM